METVKSHDLAKRLTFLASFPAAQRSLKLRKSRSKMMLEALAGTRIERGNVGIRCVHNKNTVVFSYRGTDVLVWTLPNDSIIDVDAGDFEHTPATFNQRKLAREAIDELRKSVTYL